MVGSEVGIDRALDVDSDGSTVTAGTSLVVHALVHPASCHGLPHHILLRIDSILTLQALYLGKDRPASSFQVPGISRRRPSGVGGLESCGDAQREGVLLESTLAAARSLSLLARFLAHRVFDEVFLL